MLRKATKCMCITHVIFPSLRGQTPQLDTVITEEPASVKVLSLRGNPWRLYTGPNIAITKWDLW